MKKVLIMFLIALLSFSLIACGDNAGTADTESTEVSDTAETDTNDTSESAELSKDEMLSSAVPFTRGDADKCQKNKAFANSLIGNIYTFAGEVNSVEEDHAVVYFYIKDEEGSTSYETMEAHLYLSADELISLEAGQTLWFVGKLDEISSHNTQLDGWDFEVLEMIFRNVAITGDRFEATGRLYSKNDSYGEDAWNVTPLEDLNDGNDVSVSYVVHFREDVSSEEGEDITFSYKKTSEGNVDAVIVDSTSQKPIEDRLTDFDYKDREFFKEYVKDLEPMTENDIKETINNQTFSMRNNYGGDGDGTHSITFHSDGNLDAKYEWNGEVYVMYKTWSVNNGTVILTDSNDTDILFVPYKYDEKTYLLINEDGDYSMLLKKE